MSKTTQYQDNAPGQVEHGALAQRTQAKDFSSGPETRPETQEATQALSRHASPRPPSQHSQEGRQSPSWAGETATQLLDTGSSPPDFFAVTTEDRNHKRRHSSKIGHTEAAGAKNHTSTSPPARAQGSPSKTASTRTESHAGIFNTYNEPQSLSDPYASAEDDADGPLDEESGLLRQRSRPRKLGWRRVGGCCKPRALTNWILAFGILIVIFFIARATREIANSSPR
ncbi:hypothetical protein MBLNU230_g0390t1 [Neophaeotheca triangularis]